MERGDTFGFRGVENRAVELSVEPTMRIFNTRLPSNSSCTFQFSVHHRSTGKGHICLLTTTLCIPISAFTLDKIENVAPRPPAIPDYRFRMLTDKSRLDFTIRCRDGNILVAKEGIFLASEYFRNYLESADHTDANFGDVNREPVLIAITFALTGTMAPPEFLSPSIVNDVIDTARSEEKFMKLLRLSIENSCSTGYETSYTSIYEVVPCYGLQLNHLFLTVRFENELKGRDERTRSRNDRLKV
uniref:BTB domain-containing protein n=1 Tax=Angiostrongylus cantonensis TaxID=6313 RepID=A0A158P8U6_ANGCA